MHPNAKKRLQLSRQTLRSLHTLGERELKDVVGGITALPCQTIPVGACDATMRACGDSALTLC